MKKNLLKKASQLATSKGFTVEQCSTDLFIASKDGKLRFAIGYAHSPVDNEQYLTQLKQAKNNHLAREVFDILNESESKK